MNRRGFLGSVIAVLMAPFAVKLAPKIVLTPYTGKIALFNPSANVASLYQGGALTRTVGADWYYYPESNTFSTGDTFTNVGFYATEENQPKRIQQFTTTDSRDWCGTELP